MRSLRTNLASVLLCLCAFTGAAQVGLRSPAFLASRPASAGGGGGGGISSPTNLTQRMFWYSGDAAYAQLGAEGVNAVTTLNSIIDGPSLNAFSSRFAGLSNNWVNGRAAILFIGANDQLTNINSTYTWSQPFYVFTVERTLSSGSSQFVVCSTNSAATLYTGANLFRAGAGTNIEISPGTLSSWKIVTTYFNGSSSWIRTNGVAAVSGDVSSGTWSGMTLGGTIGGTARWNGNLAETFGCQDALTTNDIIFLERQLGTNYGITVP